MDRLPELCARFTELVQDPVHNEPVLPFITELEEREDIFWEYRELAREYTGSTRGLSAVSLGIILVAPVEALRAQLEVVRTAGRERTIIACGSIVTLGGGFAISAIRAFVARGDRPASAATPPQRGPSYSPSTRTPKRQRVHSRSISSRRANAVALAKARDNRECVLSGMEDPEAARIFPVSTTEERNISVLSDLLKIWWGKEKAGRWSALFQDQGVTESAQNLVCLNHQLHWWFHNANFALKPLRKTEDGGVIVQFHWLKANGLKPHTPLRGDLSFSDILSEAGLSDNHAWGDKLAHRKSGLPLQTGQTFVLGAKYPEQAPSFELLQLSWDLLRVAAICGADENYPALEYWTWEEDEDGQWVFLPPGFESGEEDEELEERGRSRHRR